MSETFEDGEYLRFLAYGHQLIEIHIGLRDFLHDLERDHRVISGLLGGVRSLAAGLAADPSRAATIRAELDGLAAILETHFIGEEKRLVAVLNAIDPAAGLTGLTG